MSDLVGRLRSWSDATPCAVTSGMLREAADAVALTEAERGAVETAACEAESHQHAERAATLRGLLERTK